MNPVGINISDINNPVVYSKAYQAELDRRAATTEIEIEPNLMIRIDGRNNFIEISTGDGYDCSWEPLAPLIKWLKENRPDLLK